jgi:OHCU decarboxylase
MTPDELNRMDRESFVRQVGWVCEHSPWVAERAWSARPFHTLDDLHAALVREIEHATPDEKLALLNAHPDLGSRAKLTSASAGEQSGAGLDQLTPDEFAELQSLNAAYKERFQFPFLYAVKGSNKHQILASLRERVHRAYEAEFEEAMRQISRIVRFRLETVLDNHER